VIVVDMGVDAELPRLPSLVSRKVRRGTLNFAQQSAMTMDEAVACVESAIELAVAEIKGGHTWVVTETWGSQTTAMQRHHCGHDRGLGRARDRRGTG